MGVVRAPRDADEPEAPHDFTFHLEHGAGIIFVSDTVLDWYPPVQTWLEGRRPVSHFLRV